MRFLCVASSRILALAGAALWFAAGPDALTPSFLKTAVGAARHNFTPVIRGLPQKPPGPFEGLFFATTIAPCTVIEYATHRMMSCRLVEGRTDYRVLPHTAFVDRFQTFERAIAQSLPGYTRDVQRCERSDSLRARTLFKGTRADPVLSLDGSAMNGGYAVDLNVIPPGGVRVSFQLEEHQAAPPLGLTC